MDQNTLERMPINELKKLSKTVAAHIRTSERNQRVAALKQIASIMGEAGLTPSDIAPVGAKIKRTTRQYPVIVAKYRDPVSGKTWSGRGMTPAWLRGKKREAFLIDQKG